jgi:hypothetical protein
MHTEQSRLMPIAAISVTITAVNTRRHIPRVAGRKTRNRAP